MPTDNTFTYDEELLAAAEADTETTVGAEFDPDAEYNAPMPPLPDGWHFAKLSNRGAKNAAGEQKMFVGPRPWGENITTYFLQVEASVIDPSGPQNNKRANGNVTTHNENGADGKSRGSSASMYYRAITGQPIPGVNQGLITSLWLRRNWSESRRFGFARGWRGRIRTRPRRSMTGRRQER